MRTIFELFSQSFSAVSVWFSSILDSTGAGSIFLASVFISILFRRLIFPIFGHAGSDKAKKRGV